MRPLIHSSFPLSILWLFCMSCTPSDPPSSTTEKQSIEISDCFQEVLRISLDDHDLAAFSPSRLFVKGVFGENDAYFVLYDNRLQECIVFNRNENRVEQIFAIPKPDGWGKPVLLEVVSLDSILYFEHEHQSLVVCNPDEVLITYTLKMDKEHHQQYQNIQHLYTFLRSIDGYIGFNAWIGYGQGGYDVDYDSLMDERNMVCFFKVQGDSVVSRDVPIKPFLRKTTFPVLKYLDNPSFEVNSQSREILVYHVTTDTIYTYHWDDERITKHVISGSDIELIPPKVPRKGDATEFTLMYESQERAFHFIHFDPSSGKYLRHLIKQFPESTVIGIPTLPEIRFLQVLNSRFEVEAEMELQESHAPGKRVGDGNYLRWFDDETRELVVYKFEWEPGDE